MDKDWFFLFFDLIYVAATYKLGGVLANSRDGGPTSRESIITFIALFLLFVESWMALTDYSGRFVTVDNAHRLADIVHASLLALAVSHVHDLHTLQDARNGHMFWISFR